MSANNAHSLSKHACQLVHACHSPITVARADPEVGAEDVGLLKAVGNTIANAPGVILPALGVFLRRQFNGSWMPLLGLVGTFQLVAGVLYATHASLEPALISHRRARQQKLKQAKV